MVKRILLPFLLGITFMVVLIVSNTSTIKAACDGYCAERKPNGQVFDGCTIYRDRYEVVVKVSCRYALPENPNQ